MRALWKFLLAVALIPASVLLAVWTGVGWYLALLLPAIPIAAFYWIVLGAEVKHSTGSSFLLDTLSVLLGVPQALLGLVSIFLGVGIILWVLYNSLVNRLPEFSGFFLVFGIGPTMVLVGYGWLVRAFRKDKI